LRSSSDPAGAATRGVVRVLFGKAARKGTVAEVAAAGVLATGARAAAATVSGGGSDTITIDAVVAGTSGEGGSGAITTAAPAAG
jgi:hypothetical protein